MVCSKNQVVRLTNEAINKKALELQYRTAKVTSLVYETAPEGQRGVRLDREVAGTRWWLESQLEEGSELDLLSL